MTKLLCAFACMLLAAPVLAFQNGGSQTQYAQQIDALLAMPAEERRAELKKMDAKERVGLWFQLKKEERARKGKRAKKGDYKTPVPVDVEVPASFLNPTEMVGTIRYDNDFPNASFGGGQLVGNRFNSHTGMPMLTSGTISTINALVVPGSGITTSSAGFVIHGPQTTMGGAMAIFSTFTTASGVIDTVNFTGLGVTYTGTEFFVLFGDFSSSYIPVFGPGTTMGQGHHGVVGYTGGAGPNITGTFNLGGNLNGFVRTTGNILPVELMTFEIE